MFEAGNEVSAKHRNPAHQVQIVPKSAFPAVKLREVETKGVRKNFCQRPGDRKTHDFYWLPAGTALFNSLQKKNAGQAAGVAWGGGILVGIPGLPRRSEIGRGLLSDVRAEGQRMGDDYIARGLKCDDVIGPEMVPPLAERLRHRRLSSA